MSVKTGVLYIVSINNQVGFVMLRMIVQLLSLFAGRLGGYRTMRRLLVRKHHMHVPHSVVRLLLRQIDPVAVVARQHHRLHRRTYFSHGPNDVWHVDGYDKLRPYGILISGYVPVLHLICCSFYTVHAHYVTAAAGCLQLH